MPENWIQGFSRALSVNLRSIFEYDSLLTTLRHDVIGSKIQILSLRRLERLVGFFEGADHEYELRF